MGQQADRFFQACVRASTAQLQAGAGFESQNHSLEKSFKIVKSNRKLVHSRSNSRRCSDRGQTGGFASGLLGKRSRRRNCRAPRRLESCFSVKTWGLGSLFAPSRVPPASRGSLSRVPCSAAPGRRQPGQTPGDEAEIIWPSRAVFSGKQGTLPARNQLPSDLCVTNGSSCFWEGDVWG